MKIDEISIKRSSLNTQGKFHFHMEFAGNKFDGWFDDFGGLLQAVSDLATFVGVRTGKLKASDVKITSSRDIAPGVVNG